jgi:hypothetical protein
VRGWKKWEGGRGWGLDGRGGRDRVDARVGRCWVRWKVLCGISEEGDLVYGLLLLEHGFEDLHDKRVTLPGHHG